MQVKSFLESLRPISKTASLFRFVTGNQSADMDSVVSAISYAYFYHVKSPSEPPLLPLVNIPREEFRLRRDIVLLLKAHNITDQDLFFLEDVQSLTQAASTKLDVVLVDHCNLQGDVLTKLYEEKRLDVVGIIDHHADEEVFKNASPRIVHSNGSCSALVFNYWYSQLDGKVDSEIILLLLGPLLIDTSNMTQKVEEGDVIAFEKYGSVLGSEVVNLSTGVGETSFDEFYGTLKTAKKDLALFLFMDILRKDYKLFEFKSKSGKSATFGFSSLGKSMAWVLKTYLASEVISTFETIVKTYGLDVVVITTSYTQKENAKYTREFCYHTEDRELQELAQYAHDLQLNSDIYKFSDLEPTLQEINKTKFFKVYNQANIFASRKQVVPIVKSIIEDGKLI